MKFGETLVRRIRGLSHSKNFVAPIRPHRVVLPILSFVYVCELWPNNRIIYRYWWLSERISSGQVSMASLVPLPSLLVWNLLRSCGCAAEALQTW